MIRLVEQEIGVMVHFGRLVGEFYCDKCYNFRKESRSKKDIDKLNFRLYYPSLYFLQQIIIELVDYWFSLRYSLFIFVLLEFVVFFHSQFYCPKVYGVLTENGTCTNENLTIGNTTYILNQTLSDFIKRLTQDNRPLAELICQNMLNQNITK